MAFARTARLLLLAAPLALGLAACDKKDDGKGSSTAAGPIAKIAAPAGTNWAEKVTVTPDGGYLLGNPEAPIKLVEFGALSCSHCAEFAEKSFTKMRDDYIASGRVSYELRYFMLNALDVPAVLLATCGSPEATIPLSEQFWGWQRNMFDNLNTNAALMQAAQTQTPPQSFVSIARAAGMDKFFAERGIAADQAATCLADTGKASKLVQQTEAASKEFNVTGTPTFVLNGNKIEANTWEAVEPILQNAGAR